MAGAETKENRNEGLDGQLAEANSRSIDEPGDQSWALALRAAGRAVSHSSQALSPVVSTISLAPSMT